MEIWKSIKDYENLYEISTLGNVKSLNYGCNGKIQLLKPALNSGGYHFVTLCKNGKQKMFKIHRLVFQTFKGELIKGLVIDHISGVRTQNNVENLQQITSRANVTKGYFTKICTSKYPGVSWHKLANKWVVQIKVNDKHKYLGLFECELEASEAYQKELFKINFLSP
jgi:hypothetical protein